MTYRMRDPCESGFTREEASKTNANVSFLKQNAKAKNRYLPLQR